MTDLFSYAPSYPSAPGYKAQGTSKDAADSMKPTAARMRARCLEEIRRGECTPDECADRMKCSILSTRPRFTELHALGLIADTGERRRNESGRNAIVWRAA